MIFIYTALYPEAKAIIHRFRLKRQQTPIGFDVYEKEDMGIRLILTGVGALAAAAAVGSSLAYFRAGREDMLVNWGSCGAKGALGNVYRCHTLIDGITRRTYYPDMMIRSSLPEAGIITESQPSGGFEQELEPYLHDMEAVAVYVAGSYFLSPHQMHILKVVTDHGMPCPKAQFTQIMEQASDVCAEYVQRLAEYQSLLKESENRRMEDGEHLECLWQEFHCSSAMKASFLQCIRYWTLSGIDYESELLRMRDAGELPCRDRREGKLRFEQLKARLL